LEIKIKLVCDAFKVGIGAVPLHVLSGKILSFASRVINQKKIIINTQRSIGRFAISINNK